MSESQGKTKRAASLVGSVASVDSKGKTRNYPLWPEFTENDVNGEKWEGSAKGKEKGKSPSLQFFDDPEGKIEMPASTKVDHWKRPQDFMDSKIPVIVDTETYIDILHPNEHLCHSQVMRTIISQITALWNISRTKPASAGSRSSNTRFTPEQTDDGAWKPWEHIYSLCKAGKGHMPLYNQFGKYIVRLYWMGCWRKVVVDDLFPFDADDQLLLPVSTVDHELWPMLLSKALIKVAAIDYNLHSDSTELGDYFVIQCLTGWIPETIPLQYSHNNNVWELVKKVLPEWKLPEEKPSDAELEPAAASALSLKQNEMSAGNSASHKPDKGSGKDGKTGKESTKKKDDREKSKSSPHSARPVSARSAADKSATEETPPTHPVNVEVVVFGIFSQECESPAPLSVLREMANASEKLRKVGLSHLHPHPVLITKTRSCSLISPTPVPEIPRWKLIRPHKKRTTPFDEPQLEPEPPKPDQWLEIVSPFIGHRIAPLQIDPLSSRPRSHVAANNLDEIDEENEVDGDKNVKSKPTSKAANRLIDSVQGGLPSGRDSPQSPRNTAKVEGDQSHSTSETMSRQGEEEEGDETQEDGANMASVPEQQEVIKKTWIEFDEFCKSFTNLVIFHKPHTYPHNESAVEMKQAALNAGLATGPSGSKKGSAQMNQAPSNTNIMKAGMMSPVTPKSYEGFPAEERTPSFLFVDNLKQTELVVSYSVLPRWPGIDDRRISDKESVAGASEVASTKQDVAQTLTSGLLVAEPYSWKSLMTGQPVLRIRTTGTRAACLTLPPGRHVLRFLFNSPLGYHLHICSTTSFVYGDEDTVMAPLQEESCRFVEAAGSIMSCVEKCMDALGSDSEWRSAVGELQKAHMPYQPENKLILNKHYEAWHKAFYSTMLEILGENKPPALEFALRAFLFDSNPKTVVIPSTGAGTKEIPENWLQRTVTVEEDKAVQTLQKNWRGTYVRKLQRARNVKESHEHITVQDVLKNLRTTLQSNMQAHSLSLLRSMLKEYPLLMTKFSFYKDEWNRICFTDYQGTFPDQPPKTWFVVFREVFYVEEDTLCVPKVYVPIATCVLRVIDNDTGLEVKRVFQKVAPFIYKKNQRGYTFVAEARTLDNPLASGKWRMRLIGSMNSLPAPANNQLTAQFSVKEIKDYFVPNKANILLRYHIKLSANHVASLQLETSKSDAHIKFQILDNDKVVVATRGKGHCVIPAFYFLSNNKERAQSRLSNQDSRLTMLQASKQSVQTSGKKASGSAKNNDGKSSPKEPRRDSTDSKGLSSNDDADGDLNVVHNYTIQAVVEQKSWPLTRGQWSFVQKLKEIEKEELKAFSGKERSNSPGGQRQFGGGKPGATGDKGKKGTKVAEKGGKEKKQHDKEAGSRPPSQNIYDESRAYWTLRFVSDLERSDDVEIKKDTQRQDEIRAMKVAWESAEPGRAIKAMQSRLAYLSNNTIKPELSDKENDEEDGKTSETIVPSPEPLDDKEILLSPPHLPDKKDALKPFDVAPFRRPQSPSQVVSRFINAEDLNSLEEEEQSRRIKDHNEKRTKSLAFREQNRIDRMIMKEQQLETYQELQYALDKARTELLKPREEYRQALLEDKRAKDEAMEAAAAAALSASEATSPDPKGRKSAGKKKK